MNLDNVLNCCIEEHKIHFLGVVELVVFLERGLCLIFNLFSISQLTVEISEGSLGSIAIGVNQGYEAGKQQRLNFDDIAPILLELLLDLFFKKSFELLVVSITD